MEDKVKQLIKYLENAKEKANEASDEFDSVYAKDLGSIEFGKANAFSECILKVKQIFSM